MSRRWTYAVNSTRLSLHRPRGRWLLGIVPLLALSALLTACGGSSSSTASPTTTTPPTTAPPATTSPAGGAGRAATSSAFTKYTQCLTSHGVPAGANGLFGRRGAGSTSGGSTSGTSVPTGTRPTIPAQYQQAFQACASLRPTGGFGGGGLNSAQAAAYRNCLQIHGVKLPTPPTTTPGQTPSTGGFRGGFGQLANNPTFQAAQKACAALLPTRAGGTSSTTTATGA